MAWDDDLFKGRCLGWQLKFAIWPRRCYFTKKLIWLTTGYLGIAMITGPGEPVYERRWVDRREFLFQRIKGVI